ncbi:glycosyltransferase [Ekhidna sp.]|uniref:glycosyltransferase n=1 Tax=Ekhidna sp. TaxID=2608089 RepID=UPI003CCB7A85
MNQLPLVSVVCLSHNHQPFIKEAIQSVLKQTYTNVELIIVDDGSTDGTKEEIENIIAERKIAFIDIPQAIGNCAAFNKGFKKSSGDYIIDLAGDDILMPERILRGINTFLSRDAGVIFCDVLKIKPNGQIIDNHYKRDKKGHLIEKVPEGDLYIDLIKNYFISPPSMMIKREVLEDLGGYDESLSYEDFDFWIRSSRKWKYAFTDEVLVKKRIIKGSLSDLQFQFGTKHQESTLKVCQKIKELNETKEERSALRARCIYEIKQCVRQGNFSLIPSFIKLL